MPRKRKGKWMIKPDSGSPACRVHPAQVWLILLTPLRYFSCSTASNKGHSGRKQHSITSASQNISTFIGSATECCAGLLNRPNIRVSPYATSLNLPGNQPGCFWLSTASCLTCKAWMMLGNVVQRTPGIIRWGTTNMPGFTTTSFIPSFRLFCPSKPKAAVRNEHRGFNIFVLRG